MAEVISYGNPDVLAKYDCIKGICPRCKSKIVFTYNDWKDRWTLPNGDIEYIAPCPVCGLGLDKNFSSIFYPPKEKNEEEKKLEELMEYCTFDKVKFIQEFAKIAQERGINAENE